MAATSCAVLDGMKPDSYVELEQEAMVSSGGAAASKVAPGQPIPLTDEPLHIEASGFQPVYVIPIGAATEGVKLRMQPLPQGADAKGAPGEAQTLARSEVNQLLDAVGLALSHLGAGKAKEAVGVLTTMRSKHSDSDFLDLLYASALVSGGEQSRAIDVLDELVKRSPDNASAKNLLQKLKGAGP